jgi:hypothetical protein
MTNRLDPINLTDFTGGLNTRASPFQLSENETPESLNVAVDRLGGIYSRYGWQKWSDDDLWPDNDAWNPRRAFMHALSDGTYQTYVAANGTVLGITGTPSVGVHADLNIPCDAKTHMADFATMGDMVYIACGRELVSWKRNGAAAPTSSLAAGAGRWNDDYTNPIGGVLPKAELVESHAGYLFMANIDEDGTDRPNRIRWSHPTSPGDWAQADYIDILSEGSHITALMSFQDHLLVFKPDGIWAIYGYDADSWQVIKKSTTIGTPGPQAVTRSETAVFFYSASDHGSVYAYTGEMPQEVSPGLRRSIGQITQPELIWVGWLRRKLWVTVPWNYDGAQVDSTGVFVFDPSVGENGCWMFFESGAGGLGPLVGGSNLDAAFRPMGVMRNAECSCIVLLDAIEGFAYDEIMNESMIAATTTPDPWASAALATGAGELIIASGMPGLQPFQTIYRTPWLTAGWPTRKKSFRRPDFVCRRTGMSHVLRIQSYRDYEEINPRRQHNMMVDGRGLTVWGEFDWTLAQNAPPDAPVWGSGRAAGNKIVRAGSLGLCRAVQLRITGLTPGARWGIDAMIMKLVMRRFH